MNDLQKISLNVHGRIEDNTQFLLYNLKNLFPKNEIIFVTSDKIPKSFNNWLKYNYIKFEALKDIGNFTSFQKSNYHFLRHNFSIYRSLLLSKKKYALKIRSDSTVNHNLIDDLNKCINTIKDQKRNHLSFFKKNFPIKIIANTRINYRQPFYFPDQILFSERKFLVRYYKYSLEKKTQISIHDFHALPSPLYSKDKLFLSNEQIQGLTFIKNEIKKDVSLSDLYFDKDFTTKIYDEIIINYNFKGIYLPSRIDPRINFKRYLFETYKSNNGFLSYLSGLLFRVQYKSFK